MTDTAAALRLITSFKSPEDVWRHYSAARLQAVGGQKASDEDEARCEELKESAEKFHEDGDFDESIKLYCKAADTVGDAPFEIILGSIVPMLLFIEHYEEAGGFLETLQFNSAVRQSTLAMCYFQLGYVDHAKALAKTLPSSMKGEYLRSFSRVSSSTKKQIDDEDTIAKINTLLSYGETGPSTAALTFLVTHLAEQLRKPSDRLKTFVKQEDDRMHHMLGTKPLFVRLLKKVNFTELTVMDTYLLQRLVMLLARWLEICDYFSYPNRLLTLDWFLPFVKNFGKSLSTKEAAAKLGKMGKSIDFLLDFWIIFVLKALSITRKDDDSKRSTPFRPAPFESFLWYAKTIDNLHLYDWWQPKQIAGRSSGFASFLATFICGLDKDETLLRSVLNLPPHEFYEAVDLLVVNGAAVFAENSKKFLKTASADSNKSNDSRAVHEPAFLGHYLHIYDLLSYKLFEADHLDRLFSQTSFFVLLADQLLFFNKMRSSSLLNEEGEEYSDKLASILSFIFGNHKKLVQPNHLSGLVKSPEFCSRVVSSLVMVLDSHSKLNEDYATTSFEIVSCLVVASEQFFHDYLIKTFTSAEKLLTAIIKRKRGQTYLFCGTFRLLAFTLRYASEKDRQQLTDSGFIRNICDLFVQCLLGENTLEDGRIHDYMNIMLGLEAIIAPRRQMPPLLSAKQFSDLPTLSTLPIRRLLFVKVARFLNLQPIDGLKTPVDEAAAPYAPYVAAMLLAAMAEADSRFALLIEQNRSVSQKAIITLSGKSGNIYSYSFEVAKRRIRELDMSAVLIVIAIFVVLMVILRFFSD